MDGGIFVVFGLLCWGSFVIVFLLLIRRFVRAHERIAAAAEGVAEKVLRDGRPEVTRSP